MWAAASGCARVRAFVAHPRQSFRRCQQRGHFLHESLRAQLALWNQQPGIGLGEQFGIAQLMIVGRAGKRHEQGALARRRRFRQPWRRRSGRRSDRHRQSAAAYRRGTGSPPRGICLRCRKRRDRETRGFRSGARGSDSECVRVTARRSSRTMRFKARAPWLPPNTSSVGGWLFRFGRAKKSGRTGTPVTSKLRNQRPVWAK